MRLHTVNLVAMSHAQARVGRPSAVAGEPPRHSPQFIASAQTGCPSHGRPAYRWFGSQERYARVCSAAVSSSQQTLSPSTTQQGNTSLMPQSRISPFGVGSVLPRSCVSLALRSTAAPGCGFGSRVRALGHRRQVQLVGTRKALPSIDWPNPALNRTCHMRLRAALWQTCLRSAVWHAG